jgi:hypothetical protein
MRWVVKDSIFSLLQGALLFIRQMMDRIPSSSLRAQSAHRALPWG